MTGATDTPPARTWYDENQAALVHALDRLRARLQQRAGREPAARDDEFPRQAPAGGPPPAVDTLCATFGLSPFERDIVLLCAGVELQSDFPALCAELHGDPAKGYVTFGLALAALDDAHWSAVGPGGALRNWRLVDLSDPSTPTQSPLRLDERVLHYLTGLRYLDQHLAGYLRVSTVQTELVPSHEALAERIAAAWSDADRGTPLPVVQLCGAPELGTEPIAAAAARLSGLQLFISDAATLPTNPVDLDGLIRLCDREAALSGGVVMLDDPEPGSAPETAVRRFVEGLRAPLILAGPTRRRAHQRNLLSFDLGRPTLEEQKTLWRAELGPRGRNLTEDIDRIAAQFDLTAPAIRSACAMSESIPVTGAAASRPADDLWDACRSLARPRLDDLAQRIDAIAGWDDLVLPDVQKRLMRDVTTHLRHRSTVYDAWGFAARSRRGLGITALFAGPSGTGKTMAAEVIARDLDLDLYRIDLSQVVSKYIGETEKNLGRIFDAAEAGGAILLFDEADALFGKRTEVKDSHDRYANIEVSYLLQRMEAYRGLAILTTNNRSALDRAFMRRIRFVVTFPFPDAGQREAIWRRVFPENTPTDGLDVRRLAQLDLAGGNIRNIALNAAFLAAAEREPVRHAHLLRAARDECIKIEKPLTDAEIRGWTTNGRAPKSTSTR